MPLTTRCSGVRIISGAPPPLKKPLKNRRRRRHFRTRRTRLRDEARWERGIRGARGASLAAPGDGDDELVPDDDDVAFVESHRGYGAFFGERLEVEGIRVATTKRRKKGPDEDDVTAEYERAPRTVASRAENGEDDALKTLALPVKRLDGTVIHAPTAPAPIEGAGVDDNMHNITPAARAALKKAREEGTGTRRSPRHSTRPKRAPRRGRRLGKPSNSPTSWARLSTGKS